MDGSRNNTGLLTSLLLDDRAEIVIFGVFHDAVVNGDDLGHEVRPMHCQA